MFPANLAYANLDGANLFGSTAFYGNFRGARLRSANLGSATLVNSDFAQADLTGATLVRANLQGGFLFGADLSYADLYLATLTDAQLPYATLRDASLLAVSAGNAELVRANLTRADLRFANIVGVDVLHHLARPAAMLREVRRVLGPGGRLILVEPWTGAMGRLFYAYVHHEDCRAVADPWHRAFASDKGALEGNAMLPKILLKDRAGELDDVVGGLPVSRIEPFGSLSYLLTGGFQGWGFPFPVVEGLRRLEDTLPRGLLSVFGVRALFVLERS